MLESGRADGLLVAKLGRLTRSVRDLADLLDRFFGSGRFALLSVSENVDTGTVSGGMVLDTLTTIAQWEREAIAARSTPWP